VGPKPLPIFFLLQMIIVWRIIRIGIC
jgi:hypothetical protein